MTKYYYILSILLLSVTLGAQEKPGTDTSHMRLAACQFPVSDHISENAHWIMKQMVEAADSGARVVHFPECALSGYPGVDMVSLEGFDWPGLRIWTDSVMNLARELDIWVILGSIHELGEGFKPMNCLYVINPNGKIVERYDKRFCTKGDLEHFSAGEHFSVVNIQGVKCGFLICFDVRFPELYREYKKLEVDFIFQSFYNARQKPGGIHPKIMPVTAQTRAATNHFYMSLTNSSSPSSWPCHFITPDGLVGGSVEADKPGILLSDVFLSDKYYDASKDFREKALKGNLSSEKSPETTRYKTRNSL
jgi:predicted amidohydrolase